MSYEQTIPDADLASIAAGGQPRVDQLQDQIAAAGVAGVSYLEHRDTAGLTIVWSEQPSQADEDAVRTLAIAHIPQEDPT